MEVSREIMESNGVTAESLLAVDYQLAPGVYPDMREHGVQDDAWPEI
jgi:hypothetical protein